MARALALVALLVVGGCSSGGSAPAPDVAGIEDAIADLSTKVEALNARMEDLNRKLDQACALIRNPDGGGYSGLNPCDSR